MGGDAVTGCRDRRRSLFQSTPPHGGRRRRALRACPALAVSIHAPAWGATAAAAGYQATRQLFQSTPPHGGRPGRSTGLSELSAVSIHAPAWGATRPRSRDRRGDDCFDPRPRMGGDARHRVTDRDRKVSIHAPAWGATLLKEDRHLVRDVSIHAPAWGATFTVSIEASCNMGFDPRPRMGGDLPFRS